MEFHWITYSEHRRPCFWTLKLATAFFETVIIMFFERTTRSLHSDWICCNRPRVSVCVCVYVRLPLCVISTAQTNRLIFFFIKTLHKSSGRYLRVRFSPILIFKFDDVMVVIFYNFFKALLWSQFWSYFLQTIKRESGGTSCWICYFKSS